MQILLIKIEINKPVFSSVRAIKETAWQSAANEAAVPWEALMFNKFLHCGKANTFVYVFDKLTCRL